jgi:hypothetical protein
LISFLIDDSIACPQYLPLDDEDSKITTASIEASIY